MFDTPTILRGSLLEHHSQIFSEDFDPRHYLSKKLKITKICLVKKIKDTIKLINLDLGFRF